MKYLVIKRTPWLLLAVFGLFGFGFGFGPATPEAAGQIQLNDGEPYSGTLARGNGKKRWAYFYIDVEDWHSEVRIELQTTGRNRGNLFVRHGALPQVFSWAYHQRDNSHARKKTLVFNRESQPALRTGRYYIGIQCKAGGINYSLVAHRSASPSSRTGMGAKPFDGGTMFRVWAPFAEEVHVVGEFNDWNDWTAALQSEGNGYWSMDYRHAMPGEAYMYVIRNDGQALWRMDPREEQVTNSQGDTVIFDEAFEWTDSQFQMPSWNELVICEMHIGTFHDLSGSGPGQFDSAIEKLDHLQNLGVNAVQLMPIAEFPGDYSWGYNPSHPFAVESAYGGPVALKRFVNAAHQRGMGVLIDLVHNHWGPNDLAMWRFDGWHENDRGGIYFYQDDRANTQWGDTRPDYGRADVRQYIRDNVMMWLQDFHMDGIRWDSVLSTRTTDSGDNPEGWSLLQWINDEIDSQQPWAISIAEDLQNNDWITKDSGAGGAGFDTQWAAGFVHPVRAVIETQHDGDRDMNQIREAVQQRYNSDAFQRVIYTESHDETANGRQRVPEEIWPGNAGSWFSRKRSTLGAALVMTAPGVPMIFQGQDILEDGHFHDEDPVDWSKAATYSGIHLMYRDLIRMRRNWHNQTRGLQGQHLNFFHTNNQDKLVAFHRWDQGGAGDDVIVVCNFQDKTWTDYRIGLPKDGLWRVRFNSDWNGYSADFGNVYSPDVTADHWSQDGLNYSGSLKIAPYSVLILSQD